MSAVTQVDNTARVQPVVLAPHTHLHRLMTELYVTTGCPVIVNTSFNIRGEPIVCTPEQAYRCFMATDMDALVLENQILYKQEQPKPGETDADQYKSQFKLD
jgi:carbamoyltransferase